MYFPEASEVFQRILQPLPDARVAVVGHTRPDGDCIGSQVGLCRVLNALGISAKVLIADCLPRNLMPFVGNTPCLEMDATFNGSDHTPIFVDCADDLRCGNAIRAAFSHIWANIDHHISNQGYAQWNIVEPQRAATAEILAGMFLDLNMPVDAVTAQALYVGIATDTGQFRYPSSSQQVFEICAELISRGANPGAAAAALYENESVHKVGLLSRFLKSLQFECEGRVCIGKLRLEDYNATQASREHAEGFVNYPRSIEGVAIGAFIEELENGVKCSLRCKDAKYRVDQLAQVFGGGGHACAAGLTQTGRSVELFYSELIAELTRHLNKVPADTA